MTRTTCILMVFVLALSAALPACSDDRTVDPIIGLYYPPPTPDLGVDMAQADAGGGEDLGALDPRCKDAPEGAFCTLPNATGSCVAGRCALVACVFGWKDCDGAGETGCEADVTRADRCGACNVACRDEQSCQSGPRGWACGAGVLCEAGRFDLDGDQENGCEWSEAPEATTRVVVTPTLEVQAARRLSASGPIWLAGSGDAGRYLTRDIVDATAHPLTPLTVSDTPLGPAQAIGITGSDAQLGELFVGWQDGVGAHTVGGEQGVALTTFHSAPCQAPDKTPAPLIDLAPGRFEHGGVWAATASGVLALRRRADLCPDGRCLTDEGGFGTVDYLRAFFPYADRVGLAADTPVADARFAFSAAEVAACTPCAIDTSTGAQVEDLRCQSVAQCRPADFVADATTCPACAAAPTSGCPSLQLVALLPSPTRRALYLITRRGVVLLTHDEAGRWQPAARLEAAFDPNASPASGFLQAAVVAEGDDTERLYLLHSQGWLRPLRATFAPAEASGQPPQLALIGPDLGVALTDAERAALAARPQQLLASDPETVILLTDARARVLRPLAATYRSHTFERGAIDGELRYLGADTHPAEAGFDLLRARFGRLATQAVRREVSGDSSGE